MQHLFRSVDGKYVCHIPYCGRRFDTEFTLLRHLNLSHTPHELASMAIGPYQLLERFNRVLITKAIVIEQAPFYLNHKRAVMERLKMVRGHIVNRLDFKSKYLKDYHLDLKTPEDLVEGL